MKRMLVALDGSENVCRSLPFTKMMAGKFDADESMASLPISSSAS